MHFYLDHDWITDVGEALPTYRPPLDMQRLFGEPALGPNGLEITVRYLTPHSKWSIHSEYQDNLFMLSLSRGGPTVWMSPADAAAMFSPGRLGPLTLRNRVVKTATYEGMTPAGVPSEALLAHHRTLAAGGVSMGVMCLEFATPGFGRLSAEAGAEFAVFDMEHTGWTLETIKMLVATSRSARRHTVRARCAQAAWTVPPGRMKLVSGDRLALSRSMACSSRADCPGWMRRREPAGSPSGCGRHRSAPTSKRSFWMARSSSVSGGLVVSSRPMTAFSSSTLP